MGTDGEVLLRVLRRRREKRREKRWGEESAVAHLLEFARTHEGVEGYVEPRTMVTETTVVLVAKSGEWTRRRIAGPAAARELGQHVSIPVYDVTVVGYPARMRAWNRRVAAERKATDKATEEE